MEFFYVFFYVKIFSSQKYFKIVHLREQFAYSFTFPAKLETIL